jgi:cytochrome oxidase assembly protein ShyY1
MSPEKQGKMRTKFVLSLLLFVLVEGGLLKLAHWQHSRAIQKENQRSLIEEKIGQPPVPDLTGANAWRRTTLYGRFDHTRSRVLAHQKYGDATGWRLLTPLMMKDGREIVVDRGWLPPLPDRLSPDLGFLTPPADEQKIEGVIRTPPERKGWLKGATTSPGGKMLLFADFSSIPIQGVRVENVYIQQTSPDLPGLRTGADVPSDAGRHRQYRNTWLAMALALFLMYFYALWIFKRR